MSQWVVFTTLLAVGGTAPAGGATGTYAGLVFFALVAIGFSFLCSIAEAVLLSVSPSYIATMEGTKRAAGARLLKQLKENIDRPLAAILSLNTIAHTVGAAGVGAEAASLWGGDTGLGRYAVGLASAVMTLLILILSEIIPKTIGALYWRALAVPIAHIVKLMIVCMLPLVWISELITRLISGRGEQDVVTREEVAAMAAISAADGQLHSDETRILKNLFRFRSLTVHDIMTPRTVILAFSQDTTVGDVLGRRPQLPVSRIPIYDQTIDNVTGFVLKDEVLLEQANDRPQTPLVELRRPLKTVPATMKLGQLFDVLLDQRAHLALVVDEFGGTDGLVTLEDLMETLLGAEIVDEADTTEDMQHLAREHWEKRARALGLDLDALEGTDSAPPAAQTAESPADQEDASFAEAGDEGDHRETGS